MKILLCRMMGSLVKIALVSRTRVEGETFLPHLKRGSSLEKWDESKFNSKQKRIVKGPGSVE